MVHLVKYEDGDEEELSEAELDKIVVVNRKKVKTCTLEDKKVVVAKKKRRLDKNAHDDVDVDGDDTALVGRRNPCRSTKKKVIYFTKSDSEMDLDEEDSYDDEGVKPKKGAAVKSNKFGNGKNRMAIDSDSEEFELGPNVADDEDESIAADSESDFDSEEESSTKNKAKPVSRKGGKKLVRGEGETTAPYHNSTMTTPKQNFPVDLAEWKQSMANSDTPPTTIVQHDGVLAGEQHVRKLLLRMKKNYVAFFITYTRYLPPTFAFR